MAKVKKDSVHHHELFFLEHCLLVKMKDINTLPFDEASFYFCDPAFEGPEKPVRRVSWNAMIGVRSIEKVPSKIMLSRVESNIALESRDELTWKDPIQELDPDSWMHDLVGVDESSCGTLDYSVETLDEKSMMLNTQLTPVVDEPPPVETTIEIPVESQVMVEDDKMNQDMESLDVHSKKQEPECFGIPMGWFADLVSNVE